MVLLETLKYLQFLRGFSDDHLRRLAAMAELREFAADEVVFREGRPSASVYLVVRGHVALEFLVPTRGAMQFQTVKPGELLGWTAVLGPGPMTATATAQAPSTLLALDAAQIRAWCAGDPSFGSVFMHHLAQTLAARLSSTRLILFKSLCVVFNWIIDLYPEDPLPARQDRIARTPSRR